MLTAAAVLVSFFTAAAHAETPMLEMLRNTAAAADSYAAGQFEAAKFGSSLSFGEIGGRATVDAVAAVSAPQQAPGAQKQAPRSPSTGGGISGPTPLPPAPVAPGQPAPAPVVPKEPVAKPEPHKCPSFFSEAWAGVKKGWGIGSWAGFKGADLFNGLARKVSGALGRVGPVLSVPLWALGAVSTGIGVVGGAIGALLGGLIKGIIALF